jgi:hypothetical protein
MEKTLEHRFSIRRVTKASDSEYQKALTIYNNTTPNDIKTNTNEISKWLNDSISDNTFELLVFILYSNNDVIGLAIMSYISKSQIVIYDYIALKSEYRVNATLFSYINLIKNYMHTNSYDISYYVIEISNKNQGKSIDKESRLFKKILCLEGFGRIIAKYQTLPLGLEHYESSFDAFLYINSNDNLNIISKDTFFSIVQGIYFDYYLTWYASILTIEELKRFKEEKVDRIYNMLKKELSEEIQFKIEYTDCSMMDSFQSEKTYGYLPSKQKKGIGKPILIISIIVLAPIFIIWIYNIVLKSLGMELSTAYTTIGAIFASILSAATVTISAKKRL